MNDFSLKAFSAMFKILVMFLVCFFLVGRPCFAGEKIIMKGSTIERLKTVCTAALSYVKKHEIWGYAAHYYKLEITNRSDFPISLNVAHDVYQIVTKSNRKIQLILNASEYPKYINPGESVKIAFSDKSLAILEKEAMDARNLIIELNELGKVITLTPQ